MPSAEDARKATVDALRAALGEGRVTSCLDVADSDPRTATHVSGRSIGSPLCWTRPETTAHCATIVRIARAHGAAVCPVGEATTFWDGLRLGGAVALDVTTLRAPLEIDPARRLAWAGAGCSVRSVDRAARAVGLCLASYPDTAGDTPLGSLVAVGSTAGRGLGTVLPIDQVTGATLVLGTGEVVRAGAAHSLGGPSFLRHGLPDLLGLLTAAEGRAALLTEVGLALRPAPFLVRGRAKRAPLERAPDVDLLLDLLAIARRGMDRGTLATFRLELTAEGEEPGMALDVLFECISTRSTDDAWAEAALLRDEVAPLLGAPVPLEPEADAARAGSLPEYDERFDVPPGQHRRRIEGGAFWGAEAASSWGTELKTCLEQLLAVHTLLGDVAPVHRRLGVYPALHSVSAGVQVLARAEPARVEQTVRILSNALRELLAAGVVPYRTGNLWREAVAAKLRSATVRGDATDPSDVTARSLRALDPDEVLPGARGPRSEPASFAAAVEGEGGSGARRAWVKRALLDAHADLDELPDTGGAQLSLRFPGGHVRIAIEPSGTPRAQVSGRHLSLAYRVEGSLAPQDGAAMRDRVRAIAETFLGAESSPPLPERFLSDPSLLIETVDRLRRAEIHEAHPIAPSNLPPCMDTAVRPETPQRPLARVATPIVAPCDECGAALCCPANDRPRPAPARPLRVLRHGDAAEATLAAITAVAAAWKQPVPGVALEVLSVLFGARAGVLGVPAAPFELSLKRSASSLLPRLRLVEYSPRSRAGLPSREERAPRRRDRLVALAESLGATEARSWVELLEAEQPPGMELSFGIDADLAGGKALPQLYAHIEPRGRNEMLTTLRRVLEWSGAKPSEVEPFASLVRGYDGGDRSELVLVALAPGEGRARRTKVYFGRQLEKGHGPSGLQPADTGSLRSFASHRGLAVLACESETPSWEKWDFPCAVHFQLAAGLPSAFADGLGEEDRTRVATLFDGLRFAPWPTWLSVGNAASTLYFVPR